MISINQSKYLRSLHRKKFRDVHGQYLIEGEKIVQEALSENVSIEKIFAVAEWADINECPPNIELIVASEGEIQKITQLKSANKVIALVNKNDQDVNFVMQENQWYIGLDRLRDPGNMGTIIRTADWFGIKNVLLSNDCVEIHNPKVIQSCMGSLFRTRSIQINLLDQVKYCLEHNIPIYAAVLSGSNLFKMSNVKPGLIIFGNESTGISDEILDLASMPILIPGRGGAESLNVAVSAGIIMAWAVQFEN